MVNLTNSSVFAKSTNDDYIDEEGFDYENDDDDDEGDCWIVTGIGSILNLTTFGLGLVLTIILMLRTKRKRLWPGCLNGYFALVVPVNFLESRKKRRVIVALCAIITIDILDMILEKDYCVSKGTPRIVKVFAKVGLVILVSIKYLPLIRCIHVNSIVTYILGLLYSILNIVTVIVGRTPDLDSPIITLIEDLIFRIIIVTLAGVYVTIWFIRRIIKFEKNGPAEDNLGKYELKYVKKLLISPAKRPQDSHSYTLTKKSKIEGFKEWIRKHIYHSVPGFKYPLTILVSCTVGFIGVTKAALGSVHEVVNIYFYLTARLDYFTSEKAEPIPNFIKYIMQRLNHRHDDDDDDEIDVNVLMRTQIIILLVAVLLSEFSAYVLSTILICRLLVNYRDNVLNLYRRKSDQAILGVTSTSNVSLVVAALQFSGYQTAYLLAGYGIQGTFLFFALTAIFEVILLPVQFAHKAYFTWILNWVLAILFVLIVIKGTQQLLVKFVFLEDNGKTLAITNRRGFFITMYVVFFYNVFTGFISCIIRIIKSMLIGVIMFPRLDCSLFPNWCAGFDSGYKAYSCLLHLEALHCNPILRTFVYILLKRNVDEFSRRNYSKDCISSIDKMRSVKTSARNRWFVAVTLIRNPTLAHDRGAFLKSLALNSGDAKLISVNNKFEPETIKLKHFQKVYVQ